MTESDYIKATALGKVTSAINVLSDMVPENLKDVITDEEYSKVLPTLSKWRDRLRDHVKITE